MKCLSLRLLAVSDSVTDSITDSVTVTAIDRQERLPVHPPLPAVRRLASLPKVYNSSSDIILSYSKVYTEVSCSIMMMYTEV